MKPRPQPYAALTSFEAPPPALGGSEVGVEGAEPPLQHLLHRLEQGVVEDVQARVQGVAGQPLQPGQLVQLLMASAAVSLLCQFAFSCCGRTLPEEHPECG